MGYGTRHSFSQYTCQILPMEQACEIQAKPAVGNLSDMQEDDRNVRRDSEIGHRRTGGLQAIVKRMAEKTDAINSWQYPGSVCRAASGDGASHLGRRTGPRCPPRILNGWDVGPSTQP